jgi:hypothetical protein
MESAEQALVYVGVLKAVTELQKTTVNNANFIRTQGVRRAATFCC